MTDKLSKTFTAFRDHMIAAPLKLGFAKLCPRCPCSFRDHMIAAPLKRSRLNRLGRDAGDFPRSHDRGSIEAAVASYVRHVTINFPRSHDRGSIEAHLRIAEIHSANHPFRDHMIAAPLKPGRFEKGTTSDRGLSAIT